MFYFKGPFVTPRALLAPSVFPPILPLRKGHSLKRIDMKFDIQYFTVMLT